MRLSRHLAPLLIALLIGAAPAPADQGAADRIHGDVQFLADDLLEGRDTGSRGHAIAAAYVASRLEAIGLVPGGESGGWFVQVPLRRATIAGKPRLALDLYGEQIRLRPGVDAAILPSLTGQRRKLSAGLVFAGFGLTDRHYNLADYRSLDARGKIAVVLEGTPAGLPVDVAAHLMASKDRMAAEQGAVGLIELARYPSRSPTQLARFAAATQTGWTERDGSAGNRPAAALVRMAVSERTGEQLFRTAHRTVAQVRSDADGGRTPAGFPLPGELSIDASSSWQDFASPEVIGLLPGSDPQLRNEHVVVTAHLDHLGIRADARPGEDSIYNGALDNAAGVATMLEAARSFVASGNRPKRSVLFIANTGEEKGLLGSGYLAAHPVVAPESIVSVVDLDMPLLLYDFTDVVAFGAEHSTVAVTVRNAAKEMGIIVSPDPMPEQGLFVRSDHYPFVKRGVPAILLFTGYANGGNAAWKAFLAGNYHSVKDDLTQPIDWLAGARYAALNYRIARALADSPRRPLWYRGDYFGDSFAPGQPRAER